ncbi:MAG: lysophospholipid acyltransferase family protein [Candidatus Omnitrophica bacterium]|nr:lysophospholipid acyltransferase family protein [Candidatus Omnitrophota bacterium]MDD5352721.1 lysophospholipid acyltransferase family protein [Candidatus Omnitrophota bacterium]MDD5550320.1 lysophospholipid acyltransferase family protein [Candidatus Omnitrophota bacterium]
MFYIATVNFLFIIFKLFFRFKIEGAENVPSQGAFILASNHSSYLDPPILAAACYRCGRRKLNFLAKEELFYNKWFSLLIRNLRAFPVKRGKGDIGAIKESIRKIRNGEPLLIFPEGERSPDGSIKEGFPGIALLATKTKIPIIPAFITGAENTLSVKSKAVKFCKLGVRFGRPLLFYHQGPQGYSEITDKIMSAIKDLAGNP